MKRLFRTGMLLSLLSTAVLADIRLEGHQHIGAEQRNDLTPADPVTREQMLAYPTRFHLTQPSTITAVALENPLSLQDHLPEVWINGVSRPGSLSGNTFTFSSPLTLSSGTHTIFPDPGCLDTSDPANEIGAPCPGDKVNDIGFSAMVLLSAQDSSSIMLTQRRNVGDDHDIDDDYEDDLSSPSAWYPDASGGLIVDIPFALSTPQILAEVRLYRVRDVNATDGTVAINGNLIGTVPANVGSVTDPLILPVATSLGAGAHTLTVTSGTISDGNRDTFSWDDIILVFGNAVGGVSGDFNIVDAAGDGLNGVITTKRSGVSFELDVVALDATGTALNEAYEGSVSLDLLDASDDSGALDSFGCRSTWGVVQGLGSVSFLASDAGRKRFSLSYQDALRKARVLARSGDNTQFGCSRDAFAVRPDQLTVRASHADSLTAGTSQTLNQTGASGSPVHRAGRPFTVQVTAYNALGNITSAYNGVPEMNIASTIRGTRQGSLTADSWTGTGSGTLETQTARYSEAGTFNLQVRDADFALVDVGDGTPVSERIIDATVGVGRFVPDHFRLLSRNTPSLGPACTTFTYIGQPFSFSLSPIAEIEAVSASGSRTLNYTGLLFKLPGQAGAPSYTAINALDSSPLILDTSLVPANDNPITALSGGRAQVQYATSAQLSVPRGAAEPSFDLEVQLVAGALTDSDGISYADPVTTPLSFGEASVGNGIAFDGGGQQQRFGQLFVRNAYGSELLPLEVIYGTEVFVSAAQGFRQESADSCTTVSSTALSGDLAAVTSVSNIEAVNLGQAQIRLAAPQPASIGNVTLTVGGPLWLGIDADGDDVYGEAASGVASFGVHSNDVDEQIYLRETF